VLSKLLCAPPREPLKGHYEHLQALIFHNNILKAESITKRRLYKLSHVSLPSILNGVGKPQKTRCARIERLVLQPSGALYAGRAATSDPYSCSEAAGRSTHIV
jgi:hypothetical protein